MQPTGMERRKAAITWQRKPLDALNTIELRQALDEALSLLARRGSTSGNGQIGHGNEFAAGLMTGLFAGAVLSMIAVAMAHLI